MKRIWDALQDLDGMPQCACVDMTKCTCNIGKKLQERHAKISDECEKFLMGLNSGYGVLTNQILAMEHLSAINRAYYVIQKAEKQRQVA